MAGSLLAPGVYATTRSQSMSSVTGVSTSVGAFVDLFAQGPTNVAVKLSGPGDFDRVLGGVAPFSEASLAINQFFLNGGQQAWVVRIEAPGADVATVDLLDGTGATALAVSAVSVGDWGNQLLVGAQPDARDAAFFDLVVGVKGKVGKKDVVAVREVFRHLSADTASKDYFRTRVNAGSTLVSVVDAAGGVPAPVDPPAGGPSGTSGGTSGALVPTARPADLALTRQPQWFAPLVGGSDGDIDDATFDSNEVTKAMIGDATDGTGLHALDTIAPEIFNILCLPVTRKLQPADRSELIAFATDFCEDRRAMYIIDPPPTEPSITTASQLTDQLGDFATGLDPHPNTAVYLPNLVISDPFGSGTRQVGPSGTVAGIWARTDNDGVWIAPAGTRAQTRGATPTVVMDEAASAAMNPMGVNVIRTFPVFNNVVWGARTREGADLAASPWKYIPVRRTQLMIQESLVQSLKWTVFKPNDEALWSQIRLTIGAFMHRLFTLGAFGSTDPDLAYLVKCDADTTSADDQLRGVVNVVVGFLPQQVAEFVVIEHQLLIRPQEV